MNLPLPRTIAEYLDQLRIALRGADPALIQDALYDAEDHLRSELAENPGVPEADVIAKVASSYGSPEEVAAIPPKKREPRPVRTRKATPICTWYVMPSTSSK